MKKDLKTRFLEIKEKNEGYSTFTCLSIALCEKEYNRITIKRAFDTLVNKDDYSKSDYNTILEYLYGLWDN